jgi:tRNA modification GTPase
MSETTIAALASPPGTGGISIVRMSGPQATAIATRLFRRSSGESLSAFQSHRLYYGHIADPDDGRIIDEVLLAVMKSPRTYTREDVVEIHSHGSPAAVQVILKSVLKNGAILAEPGEFTRRAFLNGRIDLTQAEAVMDLIHARSEQALSQFAVQLNGVLRTEVERLREGILSSLVRIEAEIEFPEDIEESIDLKDICEQLRRRIGEGIRLLLASFETGRLMRDGFSVAIVGRPNVGKSSLMNRLLCQERAIVTPFPGTTRDAIEGCIQLDGLPLTLWDTAGLRETDEPVEAIGVRKALERAEASDTLLFVMEAGRAFAEGDLAILNEIKDMSMIFVLNKIDLVQDPVETKPPPGWPVQPVIAISALSGQGLAELKAAIRLSARWDSLSGASHLVVNLRQKQLLESCLQSVYAAADCIANGETAELVTVHLRDGLSQLDAVLGVGVRTDVIGDIFGTFCIGK